MEEKGNLAQERLSKLKSLRDKGIQPYGGRFIKTSPIKDLVDNYKENEDVQAAGRLTAVRTHGKSTFGDLRDSTGKVQISSLALPTMTSNLAWTQISLPLSLKLRLPMELFQKTRITITPMQNISCLGKHISGV